MINEVLAARIAAAAKYHVDANEVLAQLAIIFAGINYFNSQPEVTYRMGDTRLEDILVCEEFKDFVYPASVKLDPLDDMDEDLLVRPTTQGTFDYNIFLNAQLKIRNMFKSDMKTGVVKLSDIRKKVSFSEVFEMAVFDMNVDGDTKTLGHYSDKPYVPIKLKSGCRCFKKDFYFNAEYDKLVDCYVQKMFI